MANQQYDQLPDLIADGLQWERGSMYGLLYEGATFDAAHKRASEVGKWIKREPIQGRYVTADGEWAGNPVVFYMVLPDTQYQVIVAYDDGRHDEVLLGFFDENTDGVPIEVQRRGTLFVRPYTPQGEDPPSYSIWLRPEQA